MPRDVPGPLHSVAIVGPGDEADEVLLAAAYDVGRGIGARGATLVTGGLGGVMAAACRGGRDAGALTVGLLPGVDRDAANPYVDVAVPTGLGEARNALVARAADVVVAVGGSWGTLSEVALALRAGTPVVVLWGWAIADARGAPVPGPHVAPNPASAVALACARLGLDGPVTPRPGLDVP